MHYPAVGIGRLAGHEDVNDAERLRHDPAMRWIVGGKAVHRSAAWPSQMGRLETQWLAAPKNFAALADLSGSGTTLCTAEGHPVASFGDLERCALRAGNVHSADGWDELKPIVARYQGARSHASIFERTRPLQCSRSTSFWRRTGSNTRSGCRPTTFCRAGSAICSRAQSPRAPVPCQFQL